MSSLEVWLAACCLVGAFRIGQWLVQLLVWMGSEKRHPFRD